MTNTVAVETLRYTLRQSMRRDGRGMVPASVILDILDNLSDGGLSGEISVAADQAYTIELSAPFAYEIEQLDIVASEGSCDVEIAINGTPVTGLGAVAVSATPASAQATADNKVAAGQTVTLTVSNNSGALNVAFTLKTARS